MRVNERFQNYIELLEPLFQQLMRMEPVKVDSLPSSMPAEGIYLFTERRTHMYVGRSRRMRSRLRTHSRRSAGRNSASFAFALARKKIEKSAPAYRAMSRRALESDPEFQKLFTSAKERIGGMAIRYVGEADPTRQALLEMYVAVALGTRYNDFDTH